MYKTIIRSIFYQWLVLFIGISIGFITNAEWLGYKGVLIERSINNIFFPKVFTPELEKLIKQKGSAKIYEEIGSPKEFEILGDVVYYNDEFYWCKYKYRDSNNKLKFGESTTRVRWKTWEYDYGSDKDLIETEAQALESIKKLDAWHLKIREAIQQADKKEKELLQQESLQ